MSPRMAEGSGRGGRADPDRPALRSLATLASTLLIYYALPIGVSATPMRVALSLLGLLLGLVTLGWLIIKQLRRYLSDPDDPGVRVVSLASIFYLFVVGFASAYLLIARSADGQFVQLQTKTDALYFTMSTLATVGFGDVAATGQLARVLVTLQIVFDLVFIAALGTIFSGVLQRRAGSRMGRNSESVHTAESPDSAERPTSDDGVEEDVEGTESTGSG